MANNSLMNNPFLHASLDTFVRAVAIPSRSTKFFSKGVARQPDVLAQLYELKVNDAKRYVACK